MINLFNVALYCASLVPLQMKINWRTFKKELLLFDVIYDFFLSIYTLSC